MFNIKMTLNDQLYLILSILHRVIADNMIIWCYVGDEKKVRNP